MGPSSVCTESCSNQGRPWRLGSRLCLLKGCEQPFYPHNWRDRYCGVDCQRAAARWRQREANRRYRVSDAGKVCRRAQAVRYRQRVRERSAIDPAATNLPPAGEGYGRSATGATIRCHRPGCEERFVPAPRSPRQTFCRFACCQALRRVVLRERRWLKRFGLRTVMRPQPLDDS